MAPTLLYDTRTGTAAPDPGGTTPRAGSLHPVPRLATGRAALGGLLVTLAALGVFAAWSRASSPPSTRYLVLTADVPVGSTLLADDLGWVTVDLPSVLAAGAFDDPDAVIGSVTLAPLAEGDLLTATAVAPAAEAPDAGHEVSLTLERARAVGGALEPGERVDVMATYGTGTDAWTEVLARRAVVVALAEASDGGLAASGQVVVTLALRTPDDVLETVNALDAGAVTLVRTTYAPPTDGPDPGDGSTSYRPSAPAAHADDSADTTPLESSPVTDG